MKEYVCGVGGGFLDVSDKIRVESKKRGKEKRSRMLDSCCGHLISLTIVFASFVTLPDR